MKTPPAVTDADFARLKAYVIAATGLAYYADKDEDLAGRVGRRMAQREIGDCAAYLHVLEDEDGRGQELDRLISELTIGETYFFRQPEQFAALAQVVLPEILERNRDKRRLRIWSAGCATGAEPYSVALLLQREFAGRLAGWEVSIVATDLNREFLARAREARFDDWALRATPEEVKRACFRREGKSWILAPEYRDRVTFQYHNLVRDPFPSPAHNLCAFDLVLCRNVLIYFHREVSRAIVDRLRDCLADGGWLLVGHAEPEGELFHAFGSVIFTGETLYCKGLAGEEPVVPLALPAAAGPSEPAVAPPPRVNPPPPEEEPAPDLAALRRLADRGEWERAASCCRRLLDQDGLEPATHFYHALVLEQMGRAAEAESALRRAVYLDRGHVLAHYHLGLLLQRRDRERARRAFHNVLELLARMDAAHALPECDGITAAELAALTRTYLQLLDRVSSGREAGC